MKSTYIIISLIISTVLLSSCSKTENLSADQGIDIQSIPQLESLQQSHPSDAISVPEPESASAILLRRVPELNTVSNFLENQSKGKAHLVIQDYDAIDLWSDGSSYVPVYVGEEWVDGHLVIWYWFYVCEDSDDIIISLYSGDRTALVDWRQGDQYKLEINLMQDSFTEEDAASYQLDSWLGHYTYLAYEAQDQETTYDVTIDKILDKFYADISISSPEIHVSLKAKVKGNQEKIDFLFYEVTYNWEDNFSVALNKGDKLFSLLKNGAEIETKWDALSPMEESNQKKKILYFQKDEEWKSNVTDDFKSKANSIESKEPITAEVKQAYNDFLNGSGFFKIRKKSDLSRTS